MQTWIRFDDAREAIEDHHLKIGAETDYLEAAKSASRKILEALISGYLPSRPSTPDGFFMEFRTADGTQSFTLASDGTIPPQFWIHWQEAMGIACRELVTVDGPTTATSFDGNFAFRQAEGLRDNGILQGEAKGVELMRDKLPGGLPRPKGRPRKRMHDDDAVVARARKAIDLGYERSKVVARFARFMPGKSVQLDSKKRRLRDRLRSAEGGEIIA